MRRSVFTTIAISAALACALTASAVGAASAPSDRSGVKAVVDEVVRPLMQREKIPGMAVVVVVHGTPYVFSYGVASKATREPVTPATLFEIGSMSKIFSATLAEYAHSQGRLSLSDPVSLHIPELRGSAFDHITLLNLGTHTAGGLPLQVPDTVRTTAQLLAYLNHWKPSYPPGTYRVYSDVGIGLLGMIAARSLHRPFRESIERTVFPGLGMTHSYVDVPATEMKRYAQGYTRDDRPIRVVPGVLSAEAYSVKASAGDLARFVAANVSAAPAGTVGRALHATHTGYYTAGTLIQDLVWIQYAYRVPLSRLLAGNSLTMSLQPNPAKALRPPLAPRPAVLLDKTGSTNGFAAYVAVAPIRSTGIMLLANKNYPIEARVTAAFEMLRRLDGGLAAP